MYKGFYKQSFYGWANMYLYNQRYALLISIHGVRSGSILTTYSNGVVLLLSTFFVGFGRG
jgi:hypothetical protein